MSKVTHLIDGQNFGLPRNAENLEITFDWLEEKQEGNMNTNSLEFTGPAFRYIKQRFENGMTGGVGIFEGIKYNIQIGPLGNPTFDFEGYLDGSDDPNYIGNEEIVLNVKKKEGDDWLNDVADSFSFAYLHEIGEITNSDFKRVPYVINYIPDNVQSVILSMSLYMMVKELIENSKELADLIALTVNAATPVIGVSAGVGAGVVTAWDLGDWVMYAIKVAAKIIYIIAITIAIVNLFKSLVENFFPKKRFYLGMTIYDLFEKGCNHLGLTLQSDLLKNDHLKDVVYLPIKDRKGGSDGEYGFPTNQDPIYLFGDLIRHFKKTLNADYKITNGIFRFERSDFWKQTSGYVMQNVFSDQTRLLNSYIPNTKEFTANYNIIYEFDRMDMNTLDDVTGLTYQVITKPITVNDQKLVLMKGLTQIQIPFALGKRKDSFTTFELFAKEVFKVVDGLTGIFGGGTNFANQVESRIGALLLSDHYITTPKIIKMSGNQLATDQRTKLGAKSLWENYHFISSFVEVNGNHNQWKRYPPTRVPITDAEILSIFENNFINTADGKIAMIEKLIWQPTKGTAIISTRVNDKYTNNLKLEYVG